MQVATAETDKETNGKFMWSETIAKSCSVQREEKQSGHPITSVLAQPLDETVNFGDLWCCQFSLHRFFLKVKQKDNENESGSDNVQQLSDEIWHLAFLICSPHRHATKASSKAISQCHSNFKIKVETRKFLLSLTYRCYIIIYTSCLQSFSHDSVQSYG